MDTVMIAVWAAAVILFAVIEAATLQLTSIWFAAGALGALITATFRCELWIQIVCFVVISAAVLALVRPIVKKKLQPAKSPTNADRVINKIAVVEETIDNIAAKGCVAVSGMRWSARSEDGSVIEKGKKVKVLRIEGVKLYVEDIVTDD